jgi:hypothetical protein
MDERNPAGGDEQYHAEQKQGHYAEDFAPEVEALPQTARVQTCVHYFCTFPDRGPRLCGAAFVP